MRLYILHILQFITPQPFIQKYFSSHHNNGTLPMSSTFCFTALCMSLAVLFVRSPKPEAGVCNDLALAG